MAHSNWMGIFWAYHADYNLDQEMPSLFSVNSYCSTGEILLWLLGISFLEGVRKWMPSGAFLWPALKSAVCSEKRMGRCLPEAGRNSVASGWGWEGKPLYPCRDESQSWLPCARFKLATHRDETGSIPFLMPGVICPLEDPLPRWKQGDSHSEMR